MVVRGLTKGLLKLRYAFECRYGPSGQFVGSSIPMRESAQRLLKVSPGIRVVRFGLYKPAGDIAELENFVQCFGRLGGLNGCSGERLKLPLRVLVCLSFLLEIRLEP